MRELEEQIIGSVFGEDQYRKVSFLEANDFKNYQGRPYRLFWQMVQDNKSYNLTLIRIIVKTKNEELNDVLRIAGNLVCFNNVENLGLLLIEARFKTLLSGLLGKLSFESKNRLEAEILGECQIAVSNQDVFDLSDNLIEYIGAHASKTTTKRINDFIAYRDRRANEAKQVINSL